MIATEIMTHPVLAIGPDAPLLQAIRLMTQHRVSGLPVVDGTGRVLGIVSEGDLLRRVETGTDTEKSGWLGSFLRPGRSARQYVSTHGRRVGDVMTADVVCIAEDTDVSEVVDLMETHRVRRLPVVRDGKLLGIVSRADLVRQVGAALAAEAPSADDDAIRRAVLEAMDREPWARGQSISVGVKDCVVELDGSLFDIRTREALRVLAEAVPGVKQVENRIVCVEPYSGMVTYDPAA